MSNLANYSPYNKTYKFLHFQNQAYHERNKRSAAPQVRTNIRLFDPYKLNPEASMRLSQKASESTRRCESPSSSQVVWQSGQFGQFGQAVPTVQLESPRRVIHKHHSYDRLCQQRISHENKQLVLRLMSSSCQIVPNESSRKSYSRHVTYRDIRMRYNSTAQKQRLPLGNVSLLCPALSEFNESGRASQVFEMERTKLGTARTLYRRSSMLSEKE